MIKNIDDKIYIEARKKDLVLIVVVIVLIVCLMFAVYYLQRNLVLIKSDPFVFGAVSHGIESCSCITFDGVAVNYLEEKLSVRERQPFYLNQEIIFP